MFETLRQVKEQNGVFTDLLEWMMLQQLLFETERVGTDGSLFEKNTVEYGLTRGVIGEAEEALAEIRELQAIEILTPDQTELLEKTREHLKTELCDIFIFLSSVFVHAGMSPIDVAETVIHKLEVNRAKYRVSHFTDRTIAEGLQFSRDQWNRGAQVLLGTTVEPSSGRVGEKPQEYDDFEGCAGSHT